MLLTGVSECFPDKDWQEKQDELPSQLSVAVDRDYTTILFFIQSLAAL